MVAEEQDQSVIIYVRGLYAPGFDASLFMFALIGGFAVAFHKHRKTNEELRTGA